MNLIHGLINILQNKNRGIITYEEQEEIENYLELQDKTESELIEIRNCIVNIFTEQMDKEFNRDSKLWLKLDDVMSASVMVIDSKIYDL